MSRQFREFRRSLGELKAAPKIEPCLPSPAAKPPADPGWLHEIKHDGFRMMIRRDAAGIRILTRNGHETASGCQGGASQGVSDRWRGGCL